MAPEKAPAFQFYVKEWRSSRPVQRMSFAERGMYLEMLLEQWEKFSLPDDARAVAEIIAATDVQMAEVLEAWLVLRARFVPMDGCPDRIINERLEEVRSDRRSFIKGAKKGGKARAQQAARNARGTFQPSTSPSPAAIQPVSSRHPAADQPPSSTASSSPTASSSASASAGGNAPPPDNRSKRPIFTGQRLTVFEWQLDDCARTLGDHTEAFDLHSWFFALDASAVGAGLVIPKRDGGEWLQSQLVAEAQRRGLPLRMATLAPAGKLTTRLAAAIANIEREAVEANGTKRLQ